MGCCTSQIKRFIAERLVVLSSPMEKRSKHFSMLSATDGTGSKPVLLLEGDRNLPLFSFLKIDTSILKRNVLVTAILTPLIVI